MKWDVYHLSTGAGFRWPIHSIILGNLLRQHSFAMGISWHAMGRSWEHDRFFLRSCHGDLVRISWAFHGFFYVFFLGFDEFFSEKRGFTLW
jgi:hypothetical protein